MTGPGPDELTAAETRVRDLLAGLVGAGPQPGTALVPRVVRTARWQRVVRGAAVADGVRMLLGGRR